MILLDWGRTPVVAPEVELVPLVGSENSLPSCATVGHAHR
jgi:hypothetical protein